VQQREPSKGAATIPLTVWFPWDHSGRVHGGDEGPLGQAHWVTEGGAELPVLNVAISTALVP
jgi:hypothetical protein